MNNLNVFEEVSSDVNSPRSEFYDREKTEKLPFALLPCQEPSVNGGRWVSTKCPFSKPEGGLRMGCLGREPGVRQGVRRARGEQTSEAGRKNCAAHSFNATSLQMK